MELGALEVISGLLSSGSPHPLPLSYMMGLLLKSFSFPATSDPMRLGGWMP